MMKNWVKSLNVVILGASLVFANQVPATAIMLAQKESGEPMSSPVREAGLDCRLLYAIEQVYLSQHIKYSQRDNALAERVVDQYIKRTDPTKVYLLQSDVDSIKKTMGNIFEKTKAKDCTPLDQVQKLFSSRVKERADFAKTMLGKDYKFDSKVEFVYDPQKKPFPKTKEEAEEFLKKYIHFQISNYLATDMKLEEAKSNVLKTWDRTVKRIGETKNDDIYSGYLDAFANALDPHSSYFSKDSNEEFRIQMSLELQGIGATLSSQDGFTVVEALVPGGAAARSGLVMPQDKIIAVGQGEKGNLETVMDMELRDVVKKIRGPKNTKVRLLVLRKQGEGKQKLEIALVRDKVKLEDEAASVIYQEREIGGVKRRLGILNLPSFYSDQKRGGRSSASDLKAAINEAKSKGVQGLVLDLSNNGGGSLDDAVRIAGLFFQTGNVVKQSSRDEARGELTLRDTDPTVDWNGPLVILTSRISASASEIVAGTLKDYKRAVIVGADHTFGKGSVQTVMDIPPNTGEFGAVKVTVGMFFTPGGFSTQHRGVEGDVILPGPYNSDDIGEKSLDYSLPPKQIANFISSEANNKENTAWVPVQADWIKMLADKSKGRVEKSDEFKKIVEDLNKAKAKGKLISLSDVVKEKNKKDKKKEKAQKNLSKADREKEYLKRADLLEALNVLSDLIQIENGKSVATK